MSEMSFEFYDGKSLGDVCRDIVSNSKSKRDQLDIMVAELRERIKTTNDASVLGPLVKAMMDTAVKNDELLVKLAAIGQRMVASRNLAPDGTARPGELSNEDLKYIQNSLSSLGSAASSPIEIKSKNDDE